MKRLILAATFAFAALSPLVIISPEAEARRGCCSRHGGVSGCQCADGTPLSAKCAPYYPHCNGGGADTEAAKSRLGSSSRKRQQAKPVNYNCTTMAATKQVGVWLFQSPTTKSKILGRYPQGQKLVKSGNVSGDFFEVTAAGAGVKGWAHKSVCGCL